MPIATAISPHVLYAGIGQQPFDIALHQNKEGRHRDGEETKHHQQRAVKSWPSVVLIMM
ncbi:Uncharacterised protein [Serratia fonticola]|uniref:Uncharacterized protein n=1 Tax=Serratia fonticola TaxID=47917 RepID=A0A4U9TA61_SERFO|nr:Uncharacterised protein [Serratia fonticola]